MTSAGSNQHVACDQQMHGNAYRYTETDPSLQLAHYSAVYSIAVQATAVRATATVQYISVQSEQLIVLRLHSKSLVSITPIGPRLRQRGEKERGPIVWEFANVHTEVQRVGGQGYSIKLQGREMQRSLQRCRLLRNGPNFNAPVSVQGSMRPRAHVTESALVEIYSRGVDEAARVIAGQTPWRSPSCRR